MTKKEAVIIETFTGFCMLTGADRELSYKYAEELLGHPFYTHMWSDKRIVEKLKELSKPDFLKICKGLTEEVEAVPAVHGEWLGCDIETSICSKCREEFNINRYKAIKSLKFCPNCGADMRKKV